MALGAIICKTELNVIDLDRDYYQQHSLTVAQHPSETDERLMIRLLVFALNANKSLSFTRGLSSDDEPDLWQKSLQGDIESWIELGLPSEKRLKKASGRSQQVIVYSYGGSAAEQWWKQIVTSISRFKHISVFYIDADTTKRLASFFQRKMDIQITIQDAEVAIDIDGQNLNFTPIQLR